MGRYRPCHEWEEPVDYDCMSEAEVMYLYRAIKKYWMKQARFRMTAKVHKSPLRTQTIVCCAGIINEGMGKMVGLLATQLEAKRPNNCQGQPARAGRDC